MLWDLLTGEHLRTFRHCAGDSVGIERWVNSVIFDPSGKHLVSSGQDGEMKLWSVSVKQQGRIINKRADWPVGLAVQCAGFSPDGNYMIVNRTTPRIWYVGGFFEE